MLVMMVMTADYGGGDAIITKTWVLVYMSVLGQAFETHYFIYSVQGHFFFLVVFISGIICIFINEDTTIQRAT